MKFKKDRVKVIKEYLRGERNYDSYTNRTKRYMYPFILGMPAGKCRDTFELSPHVLYSVDDDYIYVATNISEDSESDILIEMYEEVVNYTDFKHIIHEGNVHIGVKVPPSLRNFKTGTYSQMYDPIMMTREYDETFFSKYFQKRRNLEGDEVAALQNLFIRMTVCTCVLDYEYQEIVADIVPGPELDFPPDENDLLVIE